MNDTCVYKAINTFGFSALKFAQFDLFELKVSLDITNYNDKIITTDSRIGFYEVGLMHIHLNPNWDIQPEIAYPDEWQALLQ